MSNSKNAKEKAELFKTIWKLADDLRGKVAGWEFKTYVLGTLFYRYLSEKFVRKINKEAHDADDTMFDYASLTDEEVNSFNDIDAVKADQIASNGYFLYPSELFSNLQKRAKDDENLNETMQKIFKNIEESSEINPDAKRCFSGLFADFDVNSSNLGNTVAKRNEHLVKLLNGVAQMDLGDFSDNTIDLFGDAYEYLMGLYAQNGGKSGGEYFTPQEVSYLLTKLCLLNSDGTYKTRVNKVYDPTCGSGSLLLKSAKILGKENVEMGFFGQECNPTTYNLCRINMFLHGIPFDKFNIACDDTLINPQHWDDQPFEVIVSNPPYSVKWTGDDDVNLIGDPRFSPAGVLAPKSKADLAFVMHSLAWLSPIGTAAIVCFPGVMYRKGAEEKIRKYLIDNNFIDAIIQLPDNLFYGTSISTCIMTLKKNKENNTVKFVDASNEFVRDTNSNRLSDENIENILKYISDAKDVKHIIKVATRDEIEANHYCLSVSNYVEKKEDKVEVNIKELNKEIKATVAKIDKLRNEIDEIIKEIEGEDDV